MPEPLLQSSFGCYKQLEPPEAQLLAQTPAKLGSLYARDWSSDSTASSMQDGPVCFDKDASAVPEPPQPNKRIAEALAKTAFCRHHQRGHCRYGDKCSFAHEEEEMMPKPDFFKTKVCSYFLLGRCSRNRCKYAHSLNEVQEAGPRTASQAAQVAMPPAVRPQGAAAVAAGGPLVWQGKASASHPPPPAPLAKQPGIQTSLPTAPRGERQSLEAVENLYKSLVNIEKPLLQAEGIGTLKLPPETEYELQKAAHVAAWQSAAVLLAQDTKLKGALSATMKVQEGFWLSQISGATLSL